MVRLSDIVAIYKAYTHIDIIECRSPTYPRGLDRSNAVLSSNLTTIEPTSSPSAYSTTPLLAIRDYYKDIQNACTERLLQ